MCCVVMNVVSLLTGKGNSTGGSAPFVNQIRVVAFVETEETTMNVLRSGSATSLTNVSSLLHSKFNPMKLVPGVSLGDPDVALECGDSLIPHERVPLAPRVEFCGGGETALN